MPVWLQWIVWIGAGVAAAAVIWTKFLRPASKFIARIEAMAPLLVDLTEQLKGSPQSFQILKEIIAQFRSDSGSSLRDVVDRLEKAAAENRESAKNLRIKAEVLEEGVAAVKELAKKDRAQAARLEQALIELTAKVDARQIQHDSEKREEAKNG